MLENWEVDEQSSMKSFWIFSLWSPGEGGTGGSQLNEECGNPAVVTNKSLVEIGKPNEVLKLLP